MPVSAAGSTGKMASLEESTDAKHKEQRNSGLYAPSTAGRESFFSIGSDHVDGGVVPPTDVPVAFRGVLQKMGRRLKLWSARYFEIQEQQMYYYKTERKSRCLGLLDLKTCYNVEISAAASFGYAFKLYTVHREHILAARTEADRNKWMEVIADRMGGKAMQETTVQRKTKTGRRVRSERNKTIDTIPREAFEPSPSPGPAEPRHHQQPMTPDLSKRKSRLSRLVTRIQSFKKDERTRPHSYIAPETNHDEPSPQVQPRREAAVEVVVTPESPQKDPPTTSPTPPPEIVVREPTPVASSEVITTSAGDHVTRETTPTEGNVTQETPPTKSHVTEETTPTESHVIQETTPTESHVTQKTDPVAPPPPSNHVTSESSAVTEEGSEQSTTSKTPNTPPEDTPTTQPTDPTCNQDLDKTAASNTETTPTESTEPQPPTVTMAVTTPQSTSPAPKVSPLAVHAQAKPPSPKSRPTSAQQPTGRKMSGLASQLPEIPSAPLLPEEVRDFLCRRFAADDIRDFLASLPEDEDLEASTSSTALAPHYHTLLSSSEDHEDFFPTMDQLQLFLVDCD